MPRLWICGVLWALAGACVAQLTPEERQGISDALFIGNMMPSDLEGERSSSRVETIRRAANSPLEAMDALLKLPSTLSQLNLAQILSLIDLDLTKEAASIPADVATPLTIPDEVPAPLRQSVGKLVEAIRHSNSLIRVGLTDLNPEERRVLIEALPRMASGNGPIKFDFVRQAMPLEATIQGLLKRVDLRCIRRAGTDLARAVQAEVPKLKELAMGTPIVNPIRMTIDGVVLELTGVGNDLHDSTDAALCIDLGGNDRYTGRYGAGVGYSSVLIDLSGDDFYEVSDLSIGAGVLGVGIAIDGGGDDTFRSKSLAFGAGIGGVGAFLKDGGHDSYRSLGLSQGYGYLGIGLLLDTRGDDQYRLNVYGQGAAGTGGIGWLIDKAGDDGYRSGGSIPDTRIADSSLSYAQGAAYGFDAMGGLMDLAGADSYLATSRAQGFGQASGFGFLYDAEGRDRYSADHSAQACGESGGSGYLVDLAGSDAYLLRLGNGQAFGHDLGVGFLMDRVGDDLYTGNSMGPAVGNANGLALFLDSDGSDRYSGTPGIGNPARGSGSIAIFVDLSGADDYATAFLDGQAANVGEWGVALDQALMRRPKEGPASDPPTPGSKPLTDDASMDSLVTSALKDDPGAIDHLIAIGEPAVGWLCAKKLEGSGSDLIALIAWVAREVKGASEARICALIEEKNPALAAASIQVAQGAGFNAAGPKLAAALNRPELAMAAARAAGALHAVDCVPGLMAFATGSDPALARVSTLALSQIGNPRSQNLMEMKLSSGALIDRRAALAYFARLPEKGIEVARRLASSANEREARMGIELMGLVGTEESLVTVASYLKDPRRGVVIQALLSLDGKCPVASRPIMLELRQAVDPLIKAVAQRVDVGR
ncbi:MAG: hypothetical protein IT203_05180 [Fimbriimonadaceae bacterium]|nr:hypothetical protein [Fimbriimonadaceae bacterium]